MRGGVWTGAWVAVLGLVTGAWLLAERTRPPAAGAAGEPSGATASAEPVPGFRADAFFLPDDELLGFVEIPGGPFPMGSDPTADPLAYDNERWRRGGAQGSVDLPAFFIGRYEVTVAQYRAFAERTGFTVDTAALSAPPDHPVTSVTWPDALAYARWLDTRLRDWTGTPARVRRALEGGAGVTLPSEAQWEKAARGTDGRVFPWGNDAGSGRANFAARAARPVGGVGCPACAYGLSDMSGNVWEWTRSPYQPYPWDPADDREDLETEALWVMRGGSFGDPLRNVRAAVRGGADPGARRPFIGFRVVIAGPREGSGS